MIPSKHIPLLIVALFLGLLSVQLACGLGNEAGAPPPGAAPATSVAAVPLATEPVAVQMPPGIPEMRMLTLEFPPAIRAGDSDVIRLTLEVDTQGNLTPTASVAGNTTQGQVVSIPNVYATHNVLAEARLDMAGLEVRPAEAVSQPLLPGQSATYFWSVRPAEVGRYRGTVWLFLHFVPKGGGAESRQALSAQVIEIESTALFGLQSEPARWLGVVGTFFSSLLGLPFLEEAVKWMLKRVRR
jgi:hypothetical protein